MSASSSFPETVAPESSIADTEERAQADVLNQLLKPEVQESLNVLIENLPKLTELAVFLTKAYDFSRAVLTDQVLLEDFAGGIREFVKPIESKVKEYTAAALEANERAQADTTTIGVFGLLKMLKDPQVQKLFRFTQAFLDVLNERKNGM